MGIWTPFVQPDTAKRKGKITHRRQGMGLGFSSMSNGGIESIYKREFTQE